MFSVLLEDLSTKSVWLLTSVYGSKDSSLRNLLWDELNSIRSRWAGPWCLGGTGILSGIPLRSEADMEGFSDWITWLVPSSPDLSIKLLLLYRG